MQRIRIDCDRAAIHNLSMVEQARYNNKEISFSENSCGNAIEWYALSSGRTYPFASSGIKKNLLYHRTNSPPSKMSGEAMPDRTVTPLGGVLKRVRATFYSFEILQSALKPCSEGT